MIAICNTLLPALEKTLSTIDKKINDDRVVIYYRIDCDSTGDYYLIDDDLDEMWLSKFDYVFVNKEIYNDDDVDELDDINDNVISIKPSEWFDYIDEIPVVDK